MYKYFLIPFLCIVVTACDIVRIKIGEPIVDQETLDFSANGQQWTYDAKSVRQSYYNAGESDVFRYTEFYVHLIDQNGKVSNLKDKVFVLQKNGTYEQMDVPMLAQYNGLTILVNKSQMYLMISNADDFTISDKTDCKIPSPTPTPQERYIIGKFDEGRQIFLINSVLVNPLYEDTKLIDGEGPPRIYQGNLDIQPFDCN